MTHSVWPKLLTPATPQGVSGPSESKACLDEPWHNRTGTTVGMVQPTGWWALALLAKRFVIFLSGLVVIFTVLEGVLVWQAKTYPKPRRFIPRYPTPYVEFYSEAMYHGDGISTNEAGFRYSAIPKRKPEGEIRIFMLSSSLGFIGKTNDTTIPGFMETMLADANTDSTPRVRVINAASLSLATRQSLVLLVTKILDYEPDIIIVFHGPETLFYAVHEDRRIGYPYAFTIRESQDQKLRQYMEYPNHFLAAIASMQTMRRFQPDLARTLVQKELANLTKQDPITSMEELTPHIEGVANDICRMIQISATFGCRTMVAIPPWHARGLVHNAVPILKELLSEQCQSEDDTGAVFVDTNPWEIALTTQHVWHPDSIHWTDEGNQIIASKFVKALRENGLVE